MASSNSALYGPLHLSIERKSIRVLRIDDSAIDNQSQQVLQARLRVVDLVDNPTFNAVSYVWGAHDSSPPRTISCNGLSMDITSNCWAALCAITQRFGPSDVWVDSLCINQLDDREKESQIPLMSDIYSSAAVVYIWLGESTEDTEVAMQYLSSAGFQQYLPPIHDLNLRPPRDTWLYWKIAVRLFIVPPLMRFLQSWWMNGQSCSVFSAPNLYPRLHTSPDPKTTTVPVLS